MVELGRALFRGYSESIKITLVYADKFALVISSRNFVGRWRYVSNGIHPAEWESMFSLCKDAAVVCE